MRRFALVLVSLLPVAFGADSVPEIGATSPVAERRGPVLLYGDHFDDAKLNMATVGSDPKVDRVMKPDELSKSLCRVLSGRPELPKPKKRLRWRRIDHKERNIAYGWTDELGPHLAYLRNSAGQGGGRVFVPPGRYLINDRLDLPPGVELYGTDPDSSVLEANTVKPFPAGYPEKALARPKDLANVKKITIGGKEYIAGTGAPINWLPALRGKSCMVWMRTKTAVRKLTEDHAP